MDKDLQRELIEEFRSKRLHDTRQEDLNLWLLEQLESVSTLGFTLQTNTTHDEGVMAIINRTKPVLRSLLNFGTLSFWIIDEDGITFNLAECDPIDDKEQVKKELEYHVSSNVFSWALHRNHPVFVDTKIIGDRAMLHVLASQTRVIGMFMGTFNELNPFIPDATQKMISLVFLNFAGFIRGNTLLEDLKQNNENLSLEVDHRKQAEEKLRSNLKFEQRISSLMSILVTAVSSDEGINICLSEMGRFFDAYRVYLFVTDEQRQRLDCTSEWCQDDNGITLFKDEMINLSMTDFPFFIDKEFQRELIFLTPDSELLSKARKEHELIHWKDIENLVIVPLVLLDKPAGFIGFENLRRFSFKSERERNYLQVFANILGSTVKRKWSEEALKSSQAQVVHSGRLASLGEMATGVAHELNQPLAIIQAQAEIFKIDAEPDDTEVTVSISEIDQIIEEVERAARVINHMRAFARTGVEDNDLTDVCSAADRCLIFFREQFKINGIGLDVEYQPDIPVVKLDSQKFEQVVVNLMSNAKYAVDRRTSENPDPDYEKEIALKLSYNPKRNTVILEVTDNGIGMSAFELEHCCDPFFTTKSVGQGTGLGLSIVHNIVKEFSGNMSINSKKGSGSTFRIEIPRHEIEECSE